MSKELQAVLQAGDQIIAIEDARFAKSISPEQHYSQRAGDIIVVNNPRIGDSVGGTGVNGVSHNGRKNFGLGCSLRVGTFRRATPDDPGYLATREQWHAIKDAEIRYLRRESFIYSSLFLICLGLLAVKVFP